MARSKFGRCMSLSSWWRSQGWWLGTALSIAGAVRFAHAGGGGGQRADNVVVLPQVPPPAPAAAASQAASDPNGPPPPSREDGQAASQKMMEAWHAKHPDRYWEKTPLHAAQHAPSARGQQQQTYGAFTDRDEQIWEASLESFVHRGKDVFHSAQLLGSTTAISCDMCHPDAANTHPETYPKFQVQLGRVAHLRDMINWCLQNPVRAKPMADDDEKLKAMEGYIYYQRGGVPLSPGKH